MVEDPVVVIDGLLTDNWDNTNTDSITPDIEPKEDRKAVDLRDNDYVELTLTSESKSLSAQRAIDSFSIISADIMTIESRAHVINMKNEIERIVEANYLSPHSDYCTVIVVRAVDLSNQIRDAWRMTVDIELSDRLRQIGS